MFLTSRTFLRLNFENASASKVFFGVHNFFITIFSLFYVFFALFFFVCFTLFLLGATPGSANGKATKKRKTQNIQTGSVLVLKAIGGV